MSNVAVKPEKAITTLRNALESKDADLRSILPATITPERFRTIVMIAVAGDKDLAEVAETQAGRQSIIIAAITCARDGLVPDKKEAAFVVYNTKDRRTNSWSKIAQYMPMARGLQKAMRNSGFVTKIMTSVVYKNDHFEHVKGDEEKLVHIPAPLDAERGDPIGAYAIIHQKDGDAIREVLRMDDLDKIRNSSKTPDKGPWADWTEEMYRKSALRRAYKSAPSSADVDQIIENDNVHHTVTPIVDFGSQELVPARPTKPAAQLVNVNDEPVPDFGQQEAELSFSFTNWEGEIQEFSNEDDLEKAVIEAVKNSPDKSAAEEIKDQFISPEVSEAFDERFSKKSAQ